MKNLLLIIFATPVLFLSACSTSGTGLNIYSYDKEAELGNQYSTEVHKEMKVMHDPVLDAYINALGKKMISKGVEDPHFDYTFEIVDSSEVNAFAIPGGHLFVNLALLKEAQNEAEVVGVIGHEIGHVIHRHGTKKMTDAQMMQLAGIVAAEASGANAGKYVGLGVMLFGQAGLLKYGRNAELEADRTGIDILYRTGYDPNALSSFFKKLLEIEKSQGVSRGGLSQLLATHPPTADRIVLADAHVAELPRLPNPIVNSPEFDKIRKYIAPLRPSQPMKPSKASETK